MSARQRIMLKAAAVAVTGGIALLCMLLKTQGAAVLYQAF